MNELTYTSRDTTISLTSEKLTVETARELRSYEWDYGVGRKNIYASRRKTRTVSVKFVAEHDELDKLRRYADRDMTSETAGVFTAQGEWKQEGYIYGIKVDKVASDRIYGTLKVLLLQGAWYKTVTKSYVKNSAPNNTRYGLDYPTDYKYDFGYAKVSQTMDTGSYSPCDFKMTIYGTCINPVITIGKNAYRVNVPVPEGALLIIDTREKTVILRDELGYEQNVFDKAVRGDGKGKGEYIFEPLASGEMSVTWDNSYGFDIEYYVAESEPPFTQVEEVRFTSLYL